MKLPRYSFKIDENFLDYEFISEGPKGNIKKIVHFTQIGANLFNIAFGDLNEKTGEISDIVVTNNNDSHKVLVTVASAIYNFTIQYPGSTIYVRAQQRPEQDYTGWQLQINGKRSA